MSRPPHEDVYMVLGLHAPASDEDVRAAYLAKLRQLPPDRAPEQFERVRDAYEQLRDSRQRAQWVLRVDPRAPLEEALRGATQERRFVGPEAWVEALRRR